MCYVDFSTVFSCCHFFVTAAEICPSCRHTQISTYFYSVLEILKYIYSLDIFVFIGDVDRILLDSTYLYSSPNFLHFRRSQDRKKADF